METKFLLASFVLFSLGVQADPTPADGQFAVLKPRLSCEVVVPEGSSHSQVYFSKDCQTAYVLPSLKMKKTVLKPLLLSDTGICKRLDSTLEGLLDVESSIKLLNGYIKELNEKIAATTDEGQLSFFERKKANFSKQLKEMLGYKENALNPYFRTSSLRAQIRVESDIMSEVAAFQQANKNNVNENGKIYPTRFMPALISKSILAISQKDKTQAGALNIDFPGIHYIPTGSEKNEYPQGTTTLYMNGSMSGIVDLSAMSFCSTLKAIKKDISESYQDLAEVFDTAVALNIDYQVAVQAGVRLVMKSDIQTMDFLRNMQNNIRNTAFSRNEFYSQVLSGEILNSLEIQIDDKGFEVDLSRLLNGNGDEAPEEAGPLSNIIGQFISNYLEQVESKLEKLEVLSKIPEQKAKEIQAGTTTEVGGYRSICQSKSSWFGFSKKTSCHSEPIYVKVNHDGLSNLIKNNSDTSRISNMVQFESNQTTSVRHTSTFGMN